MFWPGHAVAEADDLDVDALVITPDLRKVTLNLGLQGEVSSEEFPAVEGDVVVFQRPTGAFMPRVVQLLQARGVAVVIDMDDDLSCIHPRNPAFALHHPRDGRSHHSWKHAAETCRVATLVTVTTPALAQRYGAHGRVAVIPNFVPRKYLDVDHEDSADIGWGGAVFSHPDDLQQVGHAIQRLVAEGHVFRTVGEPDGVGAALGLDRDPPSTGPVPMDQYPASIGTFGIGIAPLADTQFNRAKSRLKPLEYSAVGVPWVGSDLPDYRAYHTQGCGVIVRRPRDWERVLRSLARDPARRVELSAVGREVAARNTLEGNAWRWAEAWTRAADLAPSVRPPAPTRTEWSLPGLR
jgi:hypothetical protein